MILVVFETWILKIILEIILLKNNTFFLVKRYFSFSPDFANDDDDDNAFVALL